jgi:hypothetical protein
LSHAAVFLPALPRDGGKVPVYIATKEQVRINKR